MSAPLASCALWVAGQRMADTAARLGVVPTALAGLRVTWGRTDALSQPRAATAEARLVLPATPGRVTDMLTIGRTLSVTATIPTWGVGGASSLDLARARAVSATWDGARLTPTGPGAATLTVPPAAPSATVGAWDHLPTAAPGQTWTLTAAVTLPPAPATATLHPVTYTTPTAAPVLGPAIATTTATGTLTGTWQPGSQHAGAWVGVAVRLWPTGPTWAGVPGPWTSQAYTWAGTGDLTLTRATITPPRQGAPLTASVFEGEITDTCLSWDQRLDAPVLTLTAADLLARLAALEVGEEPWPEHTVAQRVAAIMDAADLDTPVLIDALPASRHLAPVDVDSKDVATLLGEAATSAGAVLWASTHRTTGPYLRIEDTSARTALSRLTVPATGPATVTPTTRDGYTLSAHHLGAQVGVRRTVADAITSVRLTWVQPGVGEDGKEPTLTQRTIVITDTDAQRLTGAREASVSTSLSRQDEAQAVAARLARLTSAGGWVLDSLTWDTDAPAAPASLATLAALLDATRRMGAPVRVTDLPAWIPGAPTLTAYVDGGTLTWTQERPRWVAEMTLTTATTDGAGMTWTDTPTSLTWDRTGHITWAHTASITP
ncbi:hypothetical protein [Actinomyces faecalis]|uniref:hypothetical protein n=1 Tax=Actinomyces faecalis TaxID=2722820 RepID=UPI0015534B70|nr:hypothetical protein [Actinomyces faecalis]